MSSFHLKVINVNFIVGWAVTWLKEGVNYFHSVHYSKDTLGPAAAPAQLCQGRLRPWPVAGKASVMHISLWSGTNPVNTRSCQLCQSCHGPVVSAQHRTAVLGRKRAQTDGTRPHHWSTWANISTKPQQLSLCGFQNLKLLSPPIKSHPRLHGNKPRLGTCLKGKLTIAKLYHIRKCWQTLPG